METFTTHGPEETRRLGEGIGAVLRKGDVVCVHGELGAGKTCLIQGIALGLGVDPGAYIRSPTFCIHAIHQGKLTLHHFDLYRLSGPEEMDTLDLNEYFGGEGVCAVEWAERLGQALPEERMDIFMEEISPNSRKITVFRRP